MIVHFSSRLQEAVMCAQLPAVPGCELSGTIALIQKQSC